MMTEETEEEFEIKAGFGYLDFSIFSLVFTLLVVVFLEIGKLPILAMLFPVPIFGVLFLLNADDIVNVRLAYDKLTFHYPLKFWSSKFNIALSHIEKATAGQRKIC